MADDNERRWLLVEKMASDMETIKEGVSQIPQLVERVGKLETTVGTLVVDVAVIKDIVTEHSKILHHHSNELRDIKQIIKRHDDDIAQLKVASHTH